MNHTNPLLGIPKLTQHKKYAKVVLAEPREGNVPHGEPEYRRRRREEAKENQRSADRERDEATKNSHVEKIIAALNGIIENLKGSQDEKSPKNTGDRRRHVWEIGGLWAAATVGLLAIIIGNHDASQQIGIMQSQLNEMKSQRIITIAQTRANLRRDTSVHALTEGRKPANTGEKIIGFEFSPYWNNAGNTDAIDYRGWFNLRAFGIGPKIPRALSDKDCPPIAAPDPLPEGKVILRDASVIQLAQFLSVEDAIAATDPSDSKYILMWGHMEYRDIYFPETPPHSDDWCVSVAPNDLQRALFSFIVLSEKIK
jgi:hypothetical protein